MTVSTKAPLPDRLAHAARIAGPLTVLLLASGFTGGSCGVVDEPRILPQPQPIECGQLAEDACISRGDCTAVFQEACACPGCLPGEECPPCTCEAPSFTACHPNDPCAGLGEAACEADPMCELMRLEPICPAIACAPGERCAEPICPEATFECQVREPEPPACSGVVCTLYCEYGFAAGEDGCPICACNPEPPPPPFCEPVACELYCEDGFATDENGCAICACNPTSACEALDEVACASHPECNPRYGFDPCGSACDPGEDCAAVCVPTYVYEGCAPAEQGCSDDADCPNGYCEHFATCAGLNCPPPPPSVCIESECGDGSLVVCDAIPPTCAPGETVAVRNGCFDCVDARTCR